MNLDIGHIRNLGWAKDNDKQKWIGYNRLRGQYMSALENAIPERFFNDPASCNIEGSTTQTPGLPACHKGVSAVQALGVAAQAGQKIYTITQAVYNNNPNIVSNALSAHSVDTRSAVQNALNAGLEVTIHERPVTISGWSGAGYTTIDPNTGAGGYLIEGGSNGGWLELIDNFQKYLLTPHVTGFSFGAGFKGFAESFGNFAGVFSFVVDLLSFMERCSGDDLIALIVMWTVFTLLSLLITWLIVAIFTPIFIVMLAVGFLVNLIMDFALKPFMVDKACPR